jgi:hypothetical protein
MRNRMESLRQYFTGVAYKYLSRVDTKTSGTSNQHEIGSNKLISILENPDMKITHFDGEFLYLDDNDESDDPLRASGRLSWYDPRRKTKRKGQEFRLYYPANSVTSRMTEGDFCIFAKQPNDTVWIIIAPPESTAERQLRWLFDIDVMPNDDDLTVQRVDIHRGVSMAEAMILESLGLEVRLDEKVWLKKLISKFGLLYPKTTIFSSFARKTCKQKVDPLLDPDGALTAWMEHEEILFRTLEREIVQKQLDTGFESVDHFISFSLSVQNRRKSRVGHALEHHLAAIFEVHKIPFERQATTENRTKVDFLFPSSIEYHDSLFPVEKLIMLASKSSCKDRWRQVLAEAARIKKKHLLTLEPAISAHQTKEMESLNLQLVVPKKMLATYTATQQEWVMDVSSYISFIQSTLSQKK